MSPPNAPRAEEEETDPAPSSAPLSSSSLSSMKFEDLAKLGSDHVAACLLLERRTPTVFQAVNFWKPSKHSRAVYGGHILGQAVVAATRTVQEKEFKIHSLHAYFILPGDPDVPAEYRVGLVRDGRSFASREVQTHQGDKVIFTAQMSFHRDEETPLEHQAAMPAGVPPPETLHTRRSYMESLAAKWKGTDPDKYAFAQKILHQTAWSTQATPSLEVRYVNPYDCVQWFGIEPHRQRPPRMQVWIKCKNELPAGDGYHWLHAAVCAYASDFGLMSASLFPVDMSEYYSKLNASLDHSMWFHAPFRADEWLFFDIHSTRAHAGRALMHGRMYRRDGTLCVSVAQEAVIRLRPRPKRGVSNYPAGQRTKSKHGAKKAKL